MIPAEIQRRIEEHHVGLVRVIYVGTDGVARGKAVRLAYLKEVMESGIGMTQSQLSVTVLDRLPVESRYQPVDEVRIRPDVETFRVLPYLPGHARMLADLETLAGEPWELCPRSLLRRQVERLADRGMFLEAAFENEFTLYVQREGGGRASFRGFSEIPGNVLDDWRPVDELNCFSSAAMDVGGPYVLPIIEALEQQGLVVEKWYPEAGPGQQEIPVRHQRGLAAADQQVVFRETVRGVAIARGFRVSFMPKPDPKAAGNGCHVHFSLWNAKEEKNLFFDPAAEYQFSETGRQFMAGILEHLPAILAFTAPTTNSYQRFGERRWSSCCVSWGPDNREASVRVASPYRGREEASLNLEYKPADPTCNPYLALSALVCAGLDGIDRRLDPGPPALTDPSLLPAGQCQPYPKDLAGALAELETDTLFWEIFGENRIADYLIVKRWEIAQIESMGEGAEQKAYQFRF